MTVPSARNVAFGIDALKSLQLAAGCLSFQRPPAESCTELTALAASSRLRTRDASLPSTGVGRHIRVPPRQLPMRILAPVILIVPLALSAQEITADQLKPITIRSIGPGLVTGRVADVKIDPNNTNIWYVAAAFGGVWKTVNRGVTFAPIFDDGGAFNN